MNAEQLWIAFYTIVRKEVIRFFRLWPQTLLPPVITITLYMVIFGHFLSPDRRITEGMSQMEFIMPGLIMMAIINSAFANVVGSFYIAKFQREIEELLVSPTPLWIIILGYVMGGFFRGITAGITVIGTALFFWTPQVYSITACLIFPLLSSLLFSLAGLLNAIFAKKFDDITLFSTFILTPMIYLGGVFYSVEALPPVWQEVSRLNPVLYIINGFRYGIYGVGSHDITPGIVILLTTVVLLGFANSYLLYRGQGIRE